MQDFEAAYQSMAHKRNANAFSLVRNDSSESERPKTKSLRFQFEEGALQEANRVPSRVSKAGSLNSRFEAVFHSAIEGSKSNSRLLKHEAASRHRKSMQSKPGKIAIKDLERVSTDNDEFCNGGANRKSVSKVPALVSFKNVMNSSADSELQGPREFRSALLLKQDAVPGGVITGDQT